MNCRPLGTRKRLNIAIFGIWVCRSQLELYMLLSPGPANAKAFTTNGKR